MTKVMHDRGIENFDLIARDVLDTLPNCISKIGIDFVESTLCALENFYDLVVSGSIIIFDNTLVKEILGGSACRYKGDR
tara:strand:- start:509 stop:745 length:237 start_codon:yes stop_codon:yes gene_type:complete